MGGGSGGWGVDSEEGGRGLPCLPAWRLGVLLGEFWPSPLFPPLRCPHFTEKIIGGSSFIFVTGARHRWMRELVKPYLGAEAVAGYLPLIAAIAGDERMHRGCCMGGLLHRGMLPARHKRRALTHARVESTNAVMPIIATGCLVTTCAYGNVWPAHHALPPAADKFLAKWAVASGEAEGRVVALPELKLMAFDVIIQVGGVAGG